MFLRFVLRNRHLSVKKHFSWVTSRFLVLTKLAKRSLAGSGDHRVRSLLVWVATGFRCTLRFLFWRPQRAAFLHLVRLHGWDSQIWNAIFEWFRASFCLGTSLESVDPSAFMVRTFWRPWNLKQLDFEFFVWTSVDFYTFTLLHAILIYFGRTTLSRRWCQFFTTVTNPSPCQGGMIDSWVEFCTHELEAGPSLTGRTTAEHRTVCGPVALCPCRGASLHLGATGDVAQNSLKN